MSTEVTFMEFLEREQLIIIISFSYYFIYYLIFIYLQMYLGSVSIFWSKWLKVVKLIDFIKHQLYPKEYWNSFVHQALVRRVQWVGVFEHFYTTQKCEQPLEEQMGTDLSMHTSLMQPVITPSSHRLHPLKKTLHALGTFPDPDSAGGSPGSSHSWDVHFAVWSP